MPRKKSMTVTLSDLASVIHKTAADRSCSSLGYSHSVYSDMGTTTATGSRHEEVYGAAFSDISSVKMKQKTKGKKKRKKKKMRMSLQDFVSTDCEIANALKHRLLTYDEEMRMLRKQNKMLIETHLKLQKIWNFERKKHKQRIELVQNKKRANIFSFMYR